MLRARGRTITRFLLAMLILTIGLARGAAAGQAAANASISGKVVDESGAVLPGVQITATSPALQLPQVLAVTDASGEYQLRDLPAPGLYRLAFELSGFQSHVRDGLNLPVGFAARVDVTMKIGAMGETVEVTGVNPVVDVANSSRSVAINKEELQALPKGRTMQELFPMVSGISVAGKPDVGDSNLASRSAVSTYGVNLVPTMNVEGVNITTSHDFNTGMYLSSYNFAEVEFKTTGNNAEVAMPGFNMEAVIKSGGNQFHGTAYGDYENPHWQSNNITPELEAQGLKFTNPLKEYYAYAFDLGGRVIRDKLWFYGGVSKQSQTTGLIAFVAGPNAEGCWTCGDAPPAYQTGTLPQRTLKFNYQPAAKVRLSALYTGTRKFHDSMAASATVPLPSTRVQNQTVDLWKGELQWTPSSRMVVNAIVGAAKSKTVYSAQPGMDVPGRPASREQTTGLMTGPHPSPETRPSFREPIKANLTYLAGAHTFKVGTELNFEGRATQVPFNLGNGNYMLVFNRGLPFQIRTYNYPVSADNDLSNQALFATDNWRIGRVTLNYGVRWDRYHSYYNEQHKPAGDLSPAADYPGQDVLTWSDFVPRVGAAWDLTGKGTTIVKGGYGLFGDTMGADYAGDFNPNGIVTTTYRWNGPCVPAQFNNVSFNNTSCDLTPGTLPTLTPDSPDFVSATGGLNGIVNHDLKQPRIHEYTARLEQQLVPNVALSVGYVHHRVYFNYGTVTPLRPHDVYTVAVPVVDPATGDILNLYTYPRDYAGAAFNPTMQQSAPSDRPDLSHVLEIAITKRYSKRWTGSLSFWTVKNNRWITAVPIDPNEDAFPTDETRTWEARGAGLYRAPWDLNLSFLYRAQSGIYGQRTANFSNPLLLQGTVTRRMEPFGSRQGPTVQTTNLKVAKAFTVQGVRIEAGYQVFNMFNSSAATATSYLTGTTFNRVTGIISPRVSRVSLELTF